MLNLSNLLIFLLFFTLFKSNSTNDEQNGKKVQEINKDAAKVNLALNNQNLKSNKKIVFMVEWFKFWFLKQTGLLKFPTEIFSELNTAFI